MYKEYIDAIDNGISKSIALSLAFSFAMRVYDRYIRLQILNNVDKVKLISRERFNDIQDRHYKYIIKKYEIGD